MSRSSYDQSSYSDSFKETCEHVYRALKDEHGHWKKAISEFHYIIRDLLATPSDDDKMGYFVEKHFVNSVNAILHRNYTPDRDELLDVQIVLRSCVELCASLIGFERPEVFYALQQIFHRSSHFYEAASEIEAHDSNEVVLTQEQEAELAEWRASLRAEQYIDIFCHGEWTIGKIETVSTSDMLKVWTTRRASHENPEYVRTLSAKIAPLKSHTFDSLEKWRVDLDTGTVLDCRDNVSKWYTSTVWQVNNDNWTVIIHFDGWGEKFDEEFSRSSPDLAPFRSIATGGRETGGVLCPHSELPVADRDDPEDVFAVQRGSSAFHAELVNYFGELSGFSGILGLLKNEDNVIPICVVHSMLNAMCEIAVQLSRTFSDEFISALQMETFAMFLRLSDAELRNLTKKQLDDATGCIERLLKRIMTGSDVSEKIEEFMLSMALKRVKSANIERRLNGLAYLGDVCLAVRRGNTWLEADDLLSWIRDNLLLEFLFGPNSHPQ
eukprot:270468_1